MHDAVPIAAFHGRNVLADLMRFVQKIKHQPQPAATTGGELGIADLRAGKERRVVERGQLRLPLALA